MMPMKSLFTCLVIGCFFIIGYTPNVNAQTYCTTNLYTTGCNSNDYIQSFSTTGGSTNITNNNSGCTSGAAGYVYYSSMTHTGVQGTVVNWSCTITPSFGQGIAMWVDWNNNGSFTDPGELVYASNANLAAGTTVTGSFTIPMTTIPGTKRLRVRCVYATATFDPCSTYTFAEVEDYNLVVVASAPCTGTPTAGTIAMVSSCPPTLNLVGVTLAGQIEIQWQQKAACDTGWTNIPGATGYSYSAVSQSVAMRSEEHTSE